MKRTQDVRVTGVLDTFDTLREIVRQKVDGAPWNATVRLSVEIPGGGDYSNMTLDLDECVVSFSVAWTEETEE